MFAIPATKEILRVRDTGAVLILLTGFAAGLSLIVAIGAQNAYVLRAGLTRHHVGLVVVLCATADLFLISLGVGGLGTVIVRHPLLLQVARFGGVIYLASFAYRAWQRSRRPATLVASEAVTSRGSVVTTTLALTFLNPHVYLDTVLLLGSLSAQYGHHRWFFAAGAGLASIVWFASLGLGARAASGIMASAKAWRLLDRGVAMTMVLVAVKLAITPLSGN